MVDTTAEEQFEALAVAMEAIRDAIVESLMPRVLTFARALNELSVFIREQHRLAVSRQWADRYPKLRLPIIWLAHHLPWWIVRRIDLE